VSYSSYHVLRGGSWDDYPKHLRSASRILDREYRFNVNGFRVARTLSW
jgi:formylglycine-generating enzyme required for sulfatase activity